jgi:hypothetical protein
MSFGVLHNGTGLCDLLTSDTERDIYYGGLSVTRQVPKQGKHMAIAQQSTETVKSEAISVTEPWRPIGL